MAADWDVDDDGERVIFKKIKYNSLVIYVKVMSVLLIGGILCDIL